jgi:hypothetical protein
MGIAKPSNFSPRNYQTPLKAIRARCLDCRGFEKAEVRACDFTDCSLHPLRMGKGSRSTLRPIRAYCVWCMAGQRHEVKLCLSVKCALWPYRLGRRPQITSPLPDLGATAGVSAMEDKAPVQSIEAGGVGMSKGIFRDRIAHPTRTGILAGLSLKSSPGACRGRKRGSKQ